MKHIYLNLKRFDIPPALGGVNRLAAPGKWAEAIVTGTEPGLKKYDPAEVEFVQYFPEAHILPAAAARKVPLSGRPRAGERPSLAWIYGPYYPSIRGPRGTAFLDSTPQTYYNVAAKSNLFWVVRVWGVSCWRSAAAARTM